MGIASFPYPPGGELTCPQGFTPWIEVDTNGEIVAECVQTPNYEDELALLNWAIEKAMRVRRFRTQSLTDSEKEVLRKGVYNGSGYTVYFKPFHVATAADS